MYICIDNDTTNNETIYIYIYTSVQLIREYASVHYINFNLILLIQLVQQHTDPDTYVIGARVGHHNINLDMLFVVSAIPGSIYT